MSYILGNVTLPSPKKFTRTIVETAVEHLVIFGKTTKRTTNRKEQFTLEYQYLTQSQVNAILALYEIGTVLQFSVSEGGLVIPSTDVLVDINAREYPPSAELYRENFQVLLTEVI